MYSKTNQFSRFSLNVYFISVPKIVNSINKRGPVYNVIEKRRRSRRTKNAVAGSVSQSAILYFLKLYDNTK